MQIVITLPWPAPLTLVQVPCDVSSGAYHALSCDKLNLTLSACCGCLAGSKAFLLQQRAPVIPGRQQAFAAELAAWAKAAGFAQVLLLAGLDAQYRREQQIEGSQLRFLSSSSGQEGAEQQQQGQALAHSCEAAGVQQLEPDVVQNEKELHGLLPPWPLLQELQSSGVPSTLLSTFAAEGDNAADAMQLAGTVLSLLDKQGLAPNWQQRQQMHMPCSWAGLMGKRTVDSTLF